jgi:hypothetical protein
MRRSNSRFVLPLVALCIATGCRSPMSDATMVEQLRQLADELNAGRQEAAQMHEQIDSLRTVIARQDTLLRTLAGMANVTVPPR